MPYSNFVGLNLLTAPTACPVSVADAKAHSRVLIEADDSLIAGYLWTAMLACEDRTKRAFMPQSWELCLEQWPGRTRETGYITSNNPSDYVKWSYFEVPKPPLQYVSYFTYYDTMANPYQMVQVGGPPLPPPTPGVGNYLLNIRSEPGRIQLPFAGIWPTTILIPGEAIRLGYQCGWAAFSGTVTVDLNGIATATGSPATLFDPNIIGTWITLQQGNGSPFVGSYNVQQWLSPTQIQLQVQVPNPLVFPSPTNVVYNFTANTVPQQIRTAILQVAAHYYENREPIVTGRSETAIEIPAMYDSLLTPWKITRS